MNGIARRRHASAGTARDHRGGFTLIEILLALLLMAVLLSAVGAITAQTVLAEQAESRKMRARFVRALPFQSLAEDFDNMSLEVGALGLRADARDRPVIQLCCIDRRSMGAASNARLPQIVTYRIVDDVDGANGARWARTTHSLVAHTPETERTVACGLAQVRVDILTEDGWHELQSSTEDDARFATALRVALTWIDERDSKTQVFEIDRGVVWSRHRAR